jgi:hypothetical protein
MLGIVYLAAFIAKSLRAYFAVMCDHLVMVDLARHLRHCLMLELVHLLDYDRLMRGGSVIFGME